MKHHSLFLLICFSLTIKFSFSQIPVVGIWDKKYGGTNFEWLSSFERTSDGGFVLAGTSFSFAGGNKSENTKGQLDYWVVKLDYDGNIIWDRDYGGTLDDWLNSIQETPDKGFIIGGTSRSGIGGDKTQPCLDTSFIGSEGDYWLIKIDSLGNIEWEKTFGGYNRDDLSSVFMTSDKGYMVAGSSYSDIGGDKTEALKDTAQGAAQRIDYWLIKLDSAGNKIWDKDYGGFNLDLLSSAVQTTEGGFLLAGYSTSGIGGDKSQGNFGYFDLWIIKTDSAGTLLWDKNFGGTYSEYLPKLYLDSGQYIVGSESGSSMSGNKNTATWAQSFDYWIFKIDSLGNMLWEEDFGGTGHEEFHSIRRTYDGGYILSGDSYSSFPGGDKSESNYHSEQTWIIKIDSLRNKEWDKTFQTYAFLDDETGLAIPMNNGCYFIANCSASTPGGDNTQQNWDPNGDYNDFWLIKMCDSSFLLPTAYFMSSNFICPGACLFFQNLSEHATFYEWSFPGAIPSSSTDENPQNICYSSPGIYDVQLIAGNANTSDTLLLQNYITVFSFPLPQSIIQTGDTLFAIAGSTSYQWFFSGNIIPGATDYFYIATISGDYSVVATDNNGCEVEAAITNVLASSQFTVPSSQFAVVPNPVAETINIQGLVAKSEYEVSIYNIFGEKVFLAVNCKLPIANCKLPSGIYYLEIVSDKKIYRTKFLKQ